MHKKNRLKKSAFFMCKITNITYFVILIIQGIKLFFVYFLGIMEKEVGRLLGANLRHF